jgi:hypothetical protein
MQRVLSAIVGVLIVAAPASLSAQQQIATAMAAAARRAASGATAAIQGSAVNSSNGALVNTLVRVRNARSGRIASQSLTDKLGAYTFKGLDPGSYVVELVSQSQTTIAASSLISANAGETVTAVVKLSFNPSSLGNIIGQAPLSTSGTVVSELAPQVPSTALQSIAAVVPAGPPVSEQ